MYTHRGAALHSLGVIAEAALSPSTRYLWTYDEGSCLAEDIDQGMKLGCGRPMGPLALCDLIGLDVLYSVCDSPYVGIQARRGRPAPRR